MRYRSQKLTPHKMRKTLPKCPNYFSEAYVMRLFKWPSCDPRTRPAICSTICFYFPGFFPRVPGTSFQVSWSEYIPSKDSGSRLLNLHNAFLQNPSADVLMVLKPKMDPLRHACPAVRDPVQMVKRVPCFRCFITVEEFYKHSQWLSEIGCYCDRRSLQKWFKFSKPYIWRNKSGGCLLNGQ